MGWNLKNTEMELQWPWDFGRHWTTTALKRKQQAGFDQFPRALPPQLSFWSFPHACGRVRASRQEARLFRSLSLALSASAASPSSPLFPEAHFLERLEQAAYLGRNPALAASAQPSQLAVQHNNSGLKREVPLLMQFLALCPQAHG